MVVGSRRAHQPLVNSAKSDGKSIQWEEDRAKNHVSNQGAKRLLFVLYQLLDNGHGVLCSVQGQIRVLCQTDDEKGKYGWLCSGPSGQSLRWYV